VSPSATLKSSWNLAVICVAEDPDAESQVRSCLAGEPRGRFRLDVCLQLDTAVQYLQVRPYDVLLIDLALPEERSFSTLLRARMLAPRMPVVLMTRHTDEALGIQALEAGVQEYVIRSSSPPEDLARRLRQAVIRYRLASTRRVGQRGLADAAAELVSGAVFQQQLQEKLAFAKRFGERPALLLLEVDDWEGVEQRLGRLAQTRLLHELIRRFRWCVRLTDGVSRLGPARIAVLLGDVRSNSAVRMVAERLRVAATAPCEAGGAPQRLSVSIGAAWYLQDGESCQDLVDHAVSALEEARQLGGNRWRQSGGSTVPGAEEERRFPNGLSSLWDAPLAS
jgi:diguanylate cyclase